MRIQSQFSLNFDTLFLFSGWCLLYFSGPGDDDHSLLFLIPVFVVVNLHSPICDLLIKFDGTFFNALPGKDSPAHHPLGK